MIQKRVVTHAPHLAKRKEREPAVEQTRTITITPTVLEMGSNFTVAMSKWIAAGFPTVSEEEYKRRAGICDLCPYWNPGARLGLGKCDKCGCVGKKRWLATETCPDKRW